MSDFQKTAQRIAEQLSQTIETSSQEPPTIIEISSSRQTFAFDVADVFGRCLLARLDEREDVLDAAMLEAEDRGIPLLTFPCPATALALKDGSVDAFISADTWSTIPRSDIELRVLETSRCLRSGGLLFILDRTPSPLGPLELSLKSAGFEVLSRDSWGGYHLLTARK